MSKVTVDELREAIGGNLIKGDPNTMVTGIMSRYHLVKPGMLYFDVKGGRGGNLNIIEALKKGAVGLVISKHKKVLPFKDTGIPVITVPKVREAFWRAVGFYRNKHDIPVVGVTGTSGKTTTKEMIASIFRRRWKTLKTVGNLNLPCFVPEHVLRLRSGYQAAVFEIGMNRPGHVSGQSRLLRPKVGIITHIGQGHVEHLGTPEDVIREKAGIMEGIPGDGYLILNADDPNTKKVDLTGFKGQILYYGLKNKADYKACDIETGELGTSFSVILNGKKDRFFIPTFGTHNVYNALAAITTARVFGFTAGEIRKGLAGYRKPPMRLQLHKGIKNCTLINDTYNANPDSVMAGLEVLSSLGRGKTAVAVLGNMLEQGRYAKESHRRVGQKAAELKVDWLVTVGALAREIAKGAARGTKDMKIWSFLLRQQAVEFLKNNLPNNAVVLVKGSRGAFLERVVRHLR